MKRYSFLCLFSALTITASAVIPAGASHTASGFVENKGQFADKDGRPVKELLFKSYQTANEIYVTESGLNYVFMKNTSEEEGMLSPQERCERGEIKPKEYQWCRVEMELEGAVIKKENIRREQPSGQGVLNYYYAHCPNGVMGVEVYNKITIANVYPGIDWVLHTGENNTVKYDFIVHPGANASQITLRYRGANRVVNSKNRDQLTITTSLGDVAEGKLACFVNSGAAVQAHYEVSHDDVVKIVVGEYDRTQTLVIDPPVQLLSWASYYGGTGGEGASKITTDNAGNVYIVGYCSGVPTLNMGGGAYFQGFMAGFYDAFILKFNSAGVRLWATYYGGSSDDQSFAVRTDNAGNLFVSGYTASANLPLQNAGGTSFYQGFLGGGWDAMILQFNASGVRQWATFYGGTGNEFSFEMTDDNAGNIYIAGLTGSSNFPTKNLTGAYNQAVYGGGAWDAYLIKCNAGGQIPWATYYGGNSFDTGLGITCDNAGNVYLCGGTASSNLPIQNLGGAYNQTNNAGGAADAYFVKFNNLGTRVWATYYGATNDERAMSVACDLNNNLYVGGYTWSANFPTFNPGGCAYYQGTFGGGNWDAYILKFDPLGARTWATFYGGSNTDWINSLECDNLGHLYVGGTTCSVNMPVKNPGSGAYFQGTYQGASNNAWFGGGDCFYIEFTQTGYHQWATYYGGNQLDWCTDIAIDNNNCLYATGEWWSSGINTLNPGGGAYFQPTYGTGEDSYVMKFCPTVSIYTATATPNGATCNGNNGSATASASGGYSPYTYSWSNGQTGQNATNLSAGVYTVTVTDASCATTTQTVNITQSSSTITAGTSNVTNVSCFGLANGSATVSITGGTSPYTYSWSNGATTFNIQNLAFNIYTLTVTDANGCTGTHSVAITQPSPINLQTSTTNVSCFGGNNGSVTTTVSGGTGAYTYSWSNGGTTFNIQNLTFNIYTVTVSDANGCTSTATANVAQPTSINLQTSTTPSTCGQANGTASVSASGGTGAFTYSWSNGGTQSLISNLQSSIYTVTVTDNNGCSMSATANVTGLNIDKPVFTATDTTGCVPHCVTFTNLTGNGVSYVWDLGDGNTASGASVNHCYSKPGSYNVTLTVTDVNGCSSTLVKNGYIQVYPNPIADFTVSPQPTTLLNPVIHFTDQSTGATDWLWSFGDLNASTSVLQNPVFTYQDSGCFPVQLIVKNVHGCSDTAERPACIRGYYEVFVPNAFTPDGDGLNDFFFPKGMGIDTKDYQLQIFDRWGNLIFESNELHLGWDGRANGGRDIAQMDVYVWKIMAREADSGQLHKYIGHVTLVR